MANDPAPPITMNKLYVGNLPPQVNETMLRQLLLQEELSVANILVKRAGYAFLDCPDQSSADKVIDNLNGYNYLGATLVVQPSVSSNRKNSNCRVLVSQIPLHVKFEDLEPLLSPLGRVLLCEKLRSRDQSTQTIQLTFETQEQAQQAANQLNGIEVEDARLKAELLTEANNSESNMERKSRDGSSRTRNSRGGGPFGMAGPGGGQGGGRQTDFPLRILVQSDMVGAIIGRLGSTIRTITQATRARVDVHRKDNVGSLEKAITIYGNPENCTAACERILDVMQNEANSTNKGEVVLKILASNNLIGRLIGKGGTTIKRIMQDTETKITVSSVNEINTFNYERIITVKGIIPNMSKAEALISSKLRQSYENDLQAMAPQTMMFPGLHPVAMMATAGMGYAGRGMGYANQPPYGGIYPPGPPSGPGPQGDAQETTFLYIPNSTVGAIIGTKGTHIRNIIRFSGASVKIAPLESDKPQDPQAERKVTIVGSPESQWKAQHLIFEKVREEGFASGIDDVRLTVEILVPSSQVGRIIGKGGQNVRELQRVTGSVIKLPEQITPHPQPDEETPVHIIGPFFSVQSAQRRIRSMIQSTLPPSGGGNRGRPPKRGDSQQK